MKKQNIIIAIISLIIVIGIFWLLVPKNEEVVFSGRSGENRDGTIFATVTPEYEGIFYSGPSILERIIIGDAVSDADIQFFDGTVTPSDNPVFRLRASGSSANYLQGVWEIGLDFVYGIIATVTNQTNTIFVITPK